MKSFFIRTVVTSLAFALYTHSTFALDVSSDFRNERTGLSSPYYSETAASRESMLELLDEELHREHVGIEIILAAGSEKSTEGRFGHVFLRLIDTDSDPYNDTTIGFYAVTPIGEGSSVFDYLGQGKDRLILPTVEVFNQVLLKYQTNDRRDLIRYIVPVIPEQIQTLKQVFRSVMVAPDLLGSYDLFQNNCFTALKKVMTEAKLSFYPSLFMDHMFLMEGYMRQSLMTPYPTKDILMIEGIDQVMKDIFLQLDKTRMLNGMNRGAHEAVPEEEINKTREEILMAMPEFWGEVRKLDDFTIGKLTHYWPFAWRKHRAQLIAIYKERGLEEKSFKDFTSLAEFDLRLYRACLDDDIECRDERWQASLRYWTAEELTEHHNIGRSHLQNERRRTAQLAAFTQKSMFEEFFQSLNVRDFYQFKPHKSQGAQTP